MNVTTYTGAGINDIYPALIHDLYWLERGAELVAPRGQKTHELRPVHVHLTDPLRNVVTLPTRKLNYSFMVAECLWILLGRDDVGMISHYNKEIAKFSDDGVSFYGAYGPRIRRQLPRLLKVLTGDPDTRQAVIQIFDGDVPEVTKDVPCTLFFHFLIRDYHEPEHFDNELTPLAPRLELHVAMRSSDAWLGLPYDVFNFTSLQSAVAGELRLPVGDFHLHLASSHLYETHFEKAGELLARDLRTPPVPFRSPEWLGLPSGSLGAGEHDARETGRVTASPSSFFYDYLNVLAWRAHRDNERLVGRGPLSELLYAQQVGAL